MLGLRFVKDKRGGREKVIKYGNGRSGRRLVVIVNCCCEGVVG